MEYSILQNESTLALNDGVEKNPGYYLILYKFKFVYDDLIKMSLGLLFLSEQGSTCIKIKAQSSINRHSNDNIKASFYHNQFSRVFCFMHSTTLNCDLFVQHKAIRKSLRIQGYFFSLKRCSHIGITIFKGGLIIF